MHSSPALADIDGDHLPIQRTSLAAKLRTETIHGMPKEQLLRLQERAGLGSEWGVITMPAKWFPPGTAQAPSYRRYDVNELDGSSDDVEQARLTLSRYALVLLFCKVSGRGQSKFLTPNSIRLTLVSLKSLLQIALHATPLAGIGLLGRLTNFDMQQLRQAAKAHQEVKRLQQFVDRGLWLDAPRKVESGATEQDTETTAKRIKGRKPPKPEPHQPLPDEFVAAAGWRLVWLMEQIGPALIQCGRELANVLRVAHADGSQERLATVTRRQRRSKSFLENYRWLTSNGREVHSLPFDISISRIAGRRKKGHFSWPPRVNVDVVHLLRLLQDAHLFVFLLSTGGRIGEALSLQPDCVVSVVEGKELVQGRTYKLVFDDAGKRREWPLPKIAMIAIRQQIELAAVLEALGKQKKSRRKQQDADAIWVSGNGAKVTSLPTRRMEKSIQALDVIDLLDGGALNSHRFRKTVARLVALALVGAPKILMDLFGHKTIEMTLHYMTTDPQLRAEIAEVARAQTIMFAENAIRDSERNGGGAGATLRAATRRERVRLGHDFGEDDVRRLAETLTDNGATWMLVRPGVLCTKAVGQSGPCNKSLGRPEASRCRSSCDHRLEDAALRDDVDRALGEAVGYLAEAIEQDDEIQAEMWRGQVLTHLHRFEDIREQWSANPIVAALLSQSGPAAQEAA